MERGAQPVFVDYHTLAECRYRIRKFLASSDRAAREVGLAPQHHQTLLAIKGLPKGVAPTIRVLAERLSVQPHSMVELLDRLEEKALIRREQRAEDGREVRAVITPSAERMLERLSVAHTRQLESIGPALVEALQVLTRARPIRPGE